MIKQLTTNSKSVLLVEVPEGAHGIVNAYGHLSIYDQAGMEIDIIQLQPDTYKLATLGSEITEEQWKGLVAPRITKSRRIVYHDYMAESSRVFKNTISNGPYRMGEGEKEKLEYYYLARDSGLSLIRSEGMKPETTVVLIEK